ncbi:MAG: bifunctional UDP-sugar hydrolase/5'-nucleotidase, partial [Gaiellales bacterium]
GTKRKKRGAGGRADAASGAKQVAAARGKTKWPGSPFPWVSANVVHKKTGKPVLPPYVIREINGVKVAFVGAVTKDLKKVTTAKGIPNIKALDPATAVNKYVPEIQAQGVKTIVVVVHEGGDTDKDDPTKLAGPIVKLAEDLDPEVDVIISAHSHKEYATEISGKQVIQAGSYAKALGVVDLNVDRTTGDVVSAGARLVRNDENGIEPDAKIAAMALKFHKAVAPRTERVVTTLKAPLTREAGPNGETAIGSLIAEAQRVFAKADIGFMNNGGVRQDLEAGPLKWGTLFGVQPFANHVMRLEMTGAEVRELLEQQFPEGGNGRQLQIAGLKVHLDLTKPSGQKVVSVTLADGTPLDPKKTYKIAANAFIAEGGDGFTAFKKGRKRTDVGDDLKALVKYLESGKPVPTKPPENVIIDAGSVPAHGH